MFAIAYLRNSPLGFSSTACGDGMSVRVYVCPKHQSSCPFVAPSIPSLPSPLRRVLLDGAFLKEPVALCGRRTSTRRGARSRGHGRILEEAQGRGCGGRGTIRRGRRIRRRRRRRRRGKFPPRSRVLFACFASRPHHTPQGGPTCGCLRRLPGGLEIKRRLRLRSTGGIIGCSLRVR